MSSFLNRRGEAAMALFQRDSGHLNLIFMDGRFSQRGDKTLVELFRRVFWPLKFIFVSFALRFESSKPSLLRILVKASFSFSVCLLIALVILKEKKKLKIFKYENLLTKKTI